jgi:hypothetical protein
VRAMYACYECSALPLATIMVSERYAYGVIEGKSHCVMELRWIFHSPHSRVFFAVLVCGAQNESRNFESLF